MEFRPPAFPTRRGVAAGLAATLVSLGRPVLAQDKATGEKAPREKGAGLPPPQALDWRAAPVRKNLRLDAGSTAELWAFDGKIPGPVVRIRHGDHVNLRLSNGTPKPLSLHWHGVRVPNSMDGVGGLTQEPVQPGQSFQYRFTPPDAGTFLIRPCVIGGSAEPTERGLTAMLVVEEVAPPEVDHDFALVVDDWLLTDTGDLAPFAPAGRYGKPGGRLGNWLSLNANALPDRLEVAPGSRLRLRLVNASNARSMRLRFENIRPYVIAIDGQPTDSFEPLNASVPFVPGSRYDLLIDMPPEGGAIGRVVGLVGPGVTLVSLVTEGPRRPAYPAPAPLARNRRLPAALKLEAAARKDLTITSDENADQAVAFAVNGKASAVGMGPLMSVKRGSPVVLTIHNQTAFPQPIHLHGHVFRTLHALDDGWDPFFLDTLQVPENRTVRIAFLADNPGKWLIASTVLERFDAGLWSWIEVT